MLVLTRRYGESVVINDRLVVTVVSVDRDKVRLGFDGPMDEFVVHRREVWRDIQSSKYGKEWLENDRYNPPTI